jgi:glycosyl transferase family 87
VSLVSKNSTDWIRPRSWLAALLLVIGALLLVAYTRRDEDLRGYVLVGELALQGRDLYADAPPGINTWPPLFALVCVPLALMARASSVGARFVWLGVNLAALATVLALTLRIVARGPGNERARAPVPALSSLMSLIVLVLTSRYVVSNFEHLQINLLIFLMALGGLTLIAQGRDAAGGWSLGAAAALKVMPVLFVPYLLWRRRWRAATWTSIAGLALSLSPALVFGPARLQSYLNGWTASVRAGWNVGKMNLSVYAMWDRIVGHGLIPFVSPGFDALPPSGRAAVSALLAGSLLAAAALVLWSFAPGRTDDPRAELAEWSVVFLMAALFGTVAWKAYLVVLLLPNALLLDTWRTEGLAVEVRRGALGIMLGAFVLGVLTTDGLLGRSLGGRLEMGSIVTMAALLMLVGLCWLRRRLAEGPVTT